MNPENQNLLFKRAIRDQIASYFKEDDLLRNAHYLQSIPEGTVQCQLKLKDDLVLCGLPYFFETFNYFLDKPLEYANFLEFEGSEFQKEDKKEIHFELPFSVALTAERIALNLLQHASSISTITRKFVHKAEKYNIKILDTRKTTPGLRALEKYAVRCGGGFNHRLGQADVWMIKDNHKNFFGGVKEALNFFESQGTFYNPLVLEIHSINELKEAIELKVNHVMLDNFSPDMIREAAAIKPEGMTYEVSGGINLNTIEDYLIEGVDAISVGSITYNAPHVDISLKYNK